MKTFTEWVSQYVPVRESEAEEPEEWAVTLSVDKKKHEIHWTAELNDRHKTGIFYYDMKILRDYTIERAQQEVTEIFERDVVSEIGCISNLDDVIKVQIPEVIQELCQWEKDTS